MGDMQSDYDAMIRSAKNARSRQDEAEHQSRAVLDDFVDLLTRNGVSGLPFYSETLEDSPGKIFAGFAVKKRELVSTLSFLGWGYVVDESDMTTSKDFYVQGVGIIQGHISSVARLRSSSTGRTSVVTSGGPGQIGQDHPIAYVDRWEGPLHTNVYGWDSETRRKSLLIRAQGYIASRRAY